MSNICKKRMPTIFYFININYLWTSSKIRNLIYQLICLFCEQMLFLTKHFYQTLELHDAVVCYKASPNRLPSNNYLIYLNVTISTAHKYHSITRMPLDNWRNLKKHHRAKYTLTHQLWKWATGKAQWWIKEHSLSINVQFQKISIPTARMVIGNSEGRVVSIAKKFKGKYEVHWEFQVVGGFKPKKKTSLSEVWIFLGTTQCGFGSIDRPGIICGLNLLLVFLITLTGFSQDSLVS